MRMLSHTAIPTMGPFSGCRFSTQHEKVNFVNQWFSIPCLRIVSLSFAFLTVAKHWAGVFTKLSVILHLLLSSSHCTRSNITISSGSVIVTGKVGLLLFQLCITPYFQTWCLTCHPTLHSFHFCTINPLEQLPHIFTATEIQCHKQILPSHLLFQLLCEPVQLQRSQQNSLQEPSRDLSPQWKPSCPLLVALFLSRRNTPICSVTSF